MQSHGQHVVADFWGCRLPPDEAAWRQLLEETVRAMGVTLLGLEVHLFEPQGATAFAVLAESHLAVHTWPERDYVALDVFTCGDSLTPEAGIDVLRGALRPQREQVQRIQRGEPDASRPASPGSSPQARAHDRGQPCR